MRKSAINRILLALAGIVLLGAGILILAGGFDVYQRWQLAPPTGWPLTHRDAVLLSAADRTRWTSEGWWWPAAIAALALVFLLALWWLLAQLRRTHPGHISLGGPAAVDDVELRERALSDALAADIRRQPGVTRARARMVGSPSHPAAHIDVTLSPDSEPRSVVQSLCDGPLARARQSTGRSRLPARAQLRVTPHKPHRAE
ncbi:alkaline shock response membrane anchor protein AmaP [Streptomyces sp. ISL-66]|uniref:alkaline shock response membrane anchor protein AmaP n=1 Tax=Streptomyces sp. ISL-66 TaxID=2819186 RepID=UPI001BE76454|nr:alkaline shock response membrane anchor protein AmaP [Streptomyces sp. ISL-66]MBT2471788.1 alkaline shock response membrane anchor protein AmaP [Streptomyces sp. ISL-66]